MNAQTIWIEGDIDCSVDTRGTVAALILVNQQLETELAELRAQMAARPFDEQMAHAVLH